MQSEYTSPFIPTWRNTRGDVIIFSHGDTVRQFLLLVVEPALRALDNRIAALQPQSDARIQFEFYDLLDLRTETIKTFCLSLQSIWERQFRQYIYVTANSLVEAEKKHDYLKELPTKNWPQLEVIFEDLKQLPIFSFPAYQELSLLNYLGSYCRHGDGAASRAIKTKFQKFCQIRAPRRSMDPDSPDLPEELFIDINERHLSRFADAIIGFWSDAGWIYQNSILPKHENIVASIQRREIELGHRSAT